MSHSLLWCDGKGLVRLYFGFPPNRHAHRLKNKAKPSICLPATPAAMPWRVERQGRALPKGEFYHAIAI